MINSFQDIDFPKPAEFKESYLIFIYEFVKKTTQLMMCDWKNVQMTLQGMGVIIIAQLIYWYQTDMLRITYVGTQSVLPLPGANYPFHT